tara:strand:- start:88 stop:564 length:477 start_codon:yes stop_codon:yes gene_type:complete
MKRFKQHIREKDLTAISSWKRKLKNEKGLTKDQLQMLSQMPTPVLTAVINQVGMIVAQKEAASPEEKAQQALKHAREKEALKRKHSQEKERLNAQEASLVMSDGDILDSIWKEVKPKLEKELKRGNVETSNMIARLAKFKITKAGQSRGRSFRYDLKR